MCHYCYSSISFLPSGIISCCLTIFKVSFVDLTFLNSSCFPIFVLFKLALQSWVFIFVFSPLQDDGGQHEWGAEEPTAAARPQQSKGKCSCLLCLFVKMQKQKQTQGTVKMFRCFMQDVLIHFCQEILQKQARLDLLLFESHFCNCLHITVIKFEIFLASLH